MIKEHFPNDELMINKFNMVKTMNNFNSTNYQGNRNSVTFNTNNTNNNLTNNLRNSIGGLQRNSFNNKNNLMNLFNPLINKNNESPIKIEENNKEKEETKNNFYSTQTKFLSKKKEKVEGGISFNSTLGIFENLNNKLENKNNNLLKNEKGLDQFSRTENSLKKNLIPRARNVNFQSQDMKDIKEMKNNLDKFLFDPRKKMNILENQVDPNREGRERSIKHKSNKNIGTTTKSLVDINHNGKIKFPYHNNLNKYAQGKKLLNSPKKPSNENINININNKITNIYEFKSSGDRYENDKEKYDKIKSNKNFNFSEEEISRKLNLYKSKLNSQLIKVINDEKNKEKERLSQYEISENGKERKEIEDLIARERVMSSDKIFKINE